MLTFLAAAAYLVTAALSVLAARALPGGGSHPRAGRRFWLFAGAFFVALAAMRLGGAEDAVRGLLRGWLVADGEYGSRRAIQGPIVALVMCALIAIAVWTRAASRAGGGGPAGAAIRWARRGVAAMAVLIVLRLISFHPIDVLLYRQLHLNWIVDIGSTVLVAACAIVSLRIAGRSSRAGSSAARPDRRRAAAPPADPS